MVFSKPTTKIGLEVLCDNTSLAKGWGRCALVSNPASVNFEMTPSWKLLSELPEVQLTTLFGPQHGFDADLQDNMIETSHTTHAKTGLPIYSLYSETREPSGEWLENVDTILFDIQIVGCRVYTFKYTLAACLRAAKKHGKKVVILDRPNPLGGRYVEGRVLDSNATSFVGEFEIPMRHGLSVGEAGRLFNQSIGAELDVVEMEGWNPNHSWNETGREWVMTSPNLPTLAPIFIYPGTVILEGTNISEGRGTGLPFQLIGASYIRSGEAYVERVNSYLPDGLGAYLRPVAFEPTFHKDAGNRCGGLQIHVQEAERIPSYRLGLALIRSAIDLGGNKFEWKQPPYEYDYETLPIKLIVGSQEADAKFEADDFSVEDEFWHHGLGEYIQRASAVLLYDRVQNAL